MENTNAKSVEYSEMRSEEDFSIEVTESELSLSPSKENFSQPKKGIKRRTSIVSILSPQKGGEEIWSFAKRRWGENGEDSPTMEKLTVWLWPWYRVTLISIGVGLCEFLPVLSLAWLTDLRLKKIEEAYEIHGVGAMIGISLAFAVGLTSIAVAMILIFAPLAAGSGIPGIISYLSSGYVPHKDLLRIKTVFAKMISIVLTIGGGTLVGREGPAIHIGTGGADILFRFIDHHAPASLKLVKNTERGEIFDGESAHEVAIIGASAGFATAFGAPIGGMLYVWEEMSTHWDNLRHTSLGARCFLGVVLSTLILKALAASATENYNVKFTSIVIFDDEVYADETWEYMDLPAILVLSVVCGIMSGYGAKAARVVHKFNKKQPMMRSFWAKMIYCTLVASLTAVLFCLLPLWVKNCREDVKEIAYDDDHRRLSGGESTRKYVQFNCDDGYYNEVASLTLNGPEGVLRHMMARDDQQIYIVDIIVFLLIFCPLALLPFGSSVPAGSFVPNLLIGSCLGRICGQIVNLMKTTTKPGVYAVIGAASMLGGWTRTMLAIVVTMSEITGDVSLTIPIVIAVLIARQVASLISHHSFTHSMVDHLEDEDQARIPSRWYDSTKKKARKSLSPKMDDSGKPEDGVDIILAYNDHFEGKSMETKTRETLTGTLTMEMTELDRYGIEDREDHDEENLATDTGRRGNGVCRSTSMNYEQVGEGKEKEDGNESEKAPSGLDLIKRLRKSGLTGSLQDIEIPGGYRTNYDVMTRPLGLGRKTSEDIVDDLT